jgi:hypothetical protein
MRRGIRSLLAVVLLTGCSSYAVPRYGVSVTNVAALKQTGARKINVGPFTATGGSKTEITCRAVGPIKTPDERPFEEYVRKALIDELQVAELYARRDRLRWPVISIWSTSARRTASGSSGSP